MNFEATHPKTLDEAVDLIVAGLSPEDVDYVKKEGLGGQHFFFGMAMRNGWGLWKDSDLAKYFKSTYGLGHADDMSGIILDAVEAKVKGATLDIQAEVQRYKDHWTKTGVNPLTLKEVNDGAKPGSGEEDRDS